MIVIITIALKIDITINILLIYMLCQKKVFVPLNY